MGWQNRLALHNTYLLATYSRLDPRVRQIVLFVKYWTKTRCIARPRWGTLCSYGYVLMILYYLTHVVQPSVLPNLQCLPMRGVARLDEVECEGCNIYFSKDASGWKTQNIDVISIWNWANGSLWENLSKGFFNILRLNGISRTMWSLSAQSTECLQKKAKGGPPSYLSPKYYVLTSGRINGITITNDKISVLDRNRRSLWTLT